MASTLLSRGARVEQVCVRRWTALHEAATVGCADVMELLLLHGAKVTDTDQDGVTPLAIAAEYAHFDALELLIKHGTNYFFPIPWGEHSV